jgi:alpha-L-rhamnosidase
MEAIHWTLRGNLISTPNDCPQRDERLGWMGDAQVFAQTACFELDMAGFFTKWMQDVRDAQAEDGRFPDFAPHPFDPNRRFSGNPGWADAGVIVPWRCWVNYGDRRMLERSYPGARRWVDFVHAHNPDLLWTRRRGHPLEYGDWLNGDTLRNLPDWPSTGGMVPRVIYATAFFAHSADLLSRMAGVLGHAGDQSKYADLAARVRHAFCRAFVGVDGRIEGDSQAGYALALHFDLLPADLRARAVQHMLRALDRYRGRLSTGIQSTIRLMLELSRAGHDEAAYRILLNRDIPSWLYMLDHGGTTIWERWDGYVDGRMPSPFQSVGMNSFNHYAIGAVGEWIVRTILGISPDESRPGYRHVIIRPRVGGDLTWARGVYCSIRGPISVAWSITDGQLTIDLALPPNVTASVWLPATSCEVVTEGDRPLRHAAGIRVGDADGDGLRLDMASGDYRFLLPCPLPVAASA